MHPISPWLPLGKAWTAFLAGKARRPRFKSKKRSHSSFYLANDQFELGDLRMWIPKLSWVNTAENWRFQGKITGARVTSDSTVFEIQKPLSNALEKLAHAQRSLSRKQPGSKKRENAGRRRAGDQSGSLLSLFQTV